MQQGLLSFALGVVFVLAPALFGPAAGSPGLEVLRVPGWLLVALGAVLLAAHALLRRRAVRAWAQTHFAANFALMEWNPQVLRSLAPSQFEQLCVMLFQQDGCELRARIRSDDGALDLRLRQRRPRGAVSVVRCKYLPEGEGEITLPHLLQYYGVMAAHTLKTGTYATNARFSHEALRFAADHGIRALTGEDLLALIQGRPPEQQQALMEKVLP